MSRYIDADALKGEINTAFWSEIGKIIDSAPSIDIVTCYMCKYSHITYDGQCKYCDNITDDDGDVIEVYFDADHFCSYGNSSEKPNNSDPCDGCIYDKDENVLACVACVLKDKQMERNK